MNRFSDVDSDRDPNHLIAYLDAAADGLRGLKDRATELLGATEGDHVLELGCGAGHDTIELAARGVRVVGLDRSHLMVATTRRRAAERGMAAAVVVADAARLPFQPGAFAGCRIERVLQHVNDPAAVLRCVRRAVQPGGGVSVLDVDWESFIIDGDDPELSARVTHAYRSGRLNPYLGRHLRRLLVEAGFEDVSIEIDTAVYLSIEELHGVLPLEQAVQRAQALGEIAEVQGRSWLADQERRSRDGCFFAAMNRVLAWRAIRFEDQRESSRT